MVVLRPFSCGFRLLSHLLVVQLSDSPGVIIVPEAIGWSMFEKSGWMESHIFEMQQFCMTCYNVNMFFWCTRSDGYMG